MHILYHAQLRFTASQPGSEFRIAVAGLMMANKFLDEWVPSCSRAFSHSKCNVCSNTYTNKTWSEVSGIDLAQINRIEREFLMGIDFGLYVDKPTYESWLCLLKGLVHAKDKDSKQFRRTKGFPRAPRNMDIRSLRVIIRVRHLLARRE